LALKWKKGAPEFLAKSLQSFDQKVPKLRASIFGYDFQETVGTQLNSQSRHCRQQQQQQQQQQVKDSTQTR
jgi:hypothetical protein